MQTATFDRDAKAKWYAKQHYSTDRDLQDIYHLPTGAEDREIRLVEVNKMMIGRTDDFIEPLDFGVGRGLDESHQLVILDVSPDQWQRIQEGRLELPSGWSLQDMTHFARRR